MKINEQKHHTITVELTQEDVAKALIQAAKDKTKYHLFSGESIQYQKAVARKNADKNHTVSAIVTFTNPIEVVSQS